MSSRQFTPFGGSGEIVTLDNINEYDDLPPLAEIDSPDVYEIRTGNLGTDYLVPMQDGSTDFNEWYSLVDGQIILDIPDVVVSRPEDDDASTNTFKAGIAFSSETEFSAIGFKISANTEGATRAELFEVVDEEAELIATKDISGLGAGDEFSMEADIKTSPDYNIALDAEGDDYVPGRGDYDYPYTEGDLSIIGRFIVDPSEIDDDGSPYNIVSVGDLGFD